VEAVADLAHHDLDTQQPWIAHILDLEAWMELAHRRQLDLRVLHQAHTFQLEEALAHPSSFLEEASFQSHSPPP
jgi:hypothetical protein